MADTITPAVSFAPSFHYHEEIARAEEKIFSIFQMADPSIRRSLFASLLVENATVLLSGTYGTGKTQLVNLIRTVLFSDGEGGYLFDYETCHQELTAFDVLYHLDLAELQKGREIIHPKAMIGARLKFLNEIQRANTSFFNALLPLLSEHRVTYRDIVFETPDFLCIMDRNPLDAASSEIPEAFMDRIDFSFEIEAVHLEETLRLQEIRRGENGIHWGGLEELVEPVLTFAKLEEVWQDVKRISIPDDTAMLAGMVSDALRLCIAAERSTARLDFDLNCRDCQFQAEICSHLLKVPAQRVTNSIFRLSQAIAWLNHESSVSDQHILAALPWCLAHRLNLRPEEYRKKPNAQAWVRETAIGEILRPKLPFWQRARQAYNDRDIDQLASMSENDLVVRELHILSQNRR
jgi:MoxR-like ATPase